MYYDKLKTYKKCIQRERKFSVFYVVFSSVGVLFCLIELLSLFSVKVSFLSLLLFFLFFGLPFLLLLLFGMRLLKKADRILKQLSDIEKNKVINKTFEINLYRPKIKFMTKSEFGRRYRLTREYIGITIIDHDKNEYYYFFDECMNYSKENINRTYEKFYRSLSIQCYQGTSIIRTIQNDPYFLRIRYGSLCE